MQGPRHNFFDGFKTIGRNYGPFDLALIKIGACDVTWPDIHITPEEAVQVFLDVRGKLLLPVHWGTFNLAFHAWNDPAERVLAAAQTCHSIADREFRATTRRGRLVALTTSPLTTTACWMKAFSSSCNKFRPRTSPLV